MTTINQISKRSLYCGEMEATVEMLFDGQDYILETTVAASFRSTKGTLNNILVSGQLAIERLETQGWVSAIAAYSSYQIN